MHICVYYKKNINVKSLLPCTASANLDLFNVRRELDRSEFESVRFQRSKWTSAAGIHSRHVQRVHGATDQRDLFLGRRCQHAELPATVVAYLAALLRISRRVPTRRDVTRGNRLPRFLPTARQAHAAHRRHLTWRRFPMSRSLRGRSASVSLCVIDGIEEWQH